MTAVSDLADAAPSNQEQSFALMTKAKHSDVFADYLLPAWSCGTLHVSHGGCACVAAMWKSSSFEGRAQRCAQRAFHGV